MRQILRSISAIFKLLESYRWKLFGVIYLVGFVIYKFICNAHWLEAFYLAATLFTLNIKTDFPNAMHGAETLVYIIGLIAALYTISSLLSLLAKQFIGKKNVESMIKENYILVCGLGKKASAYIDSELSAKNEQILIIENDPNNPNIEKYRNKNIPVLIADTKNVEVLSELNLKNVVHFVLLAGKDIDNLEIALGIRDVLKNETVEMKQLYLHVKDRGLDKLYKDGGLLDDSSKLEVKMFSLARNSARSLFLEHDISGVTRDYIDSNKAFGLVVVGRSLLAIEVIGQICEIAHFPKENNITIYCMDKDINRFKNDLEYTYKNIREIPNIHIEYIELDPSTNSFYQCDVWAQDITHVMLCDENAKVNLDIAVELADRTYLEEIKSKRLNTKIHVAIYENRLVAEHIKQNSDFFDYFDVFAETNEMASKRMIINEQFEMIAKFIHSDYGEVYYPDTMFGDTNKVESKWHAKAKLSDRNSSRAQAYHIPVKLKALGLRFQQSDKSRSELLIHNREIMIYNKMIDELKSLDLDDDTLVQTTKGFNDWKTFTSEFQYFPKSFDLLVEQLIRSEKNRWNAHHYLKGWVYDVKKNKDIKRHDCLVSISDMAEDTKFTVLYDIYSILYIPNFLSSVGLEIVEDEA